MPNDVKIKNAKSRRPRSREGGWRIMKGRLYARLQYTDDSGKNKEKLRVVESGKKGDVWTAVRQMRDELSQHGEETLLADKMTFQDLADKYKEAHVFPAIIKEGHKVAGLKSYKPVETYINIATEYFGRKVIRAIRPRDIEKFRITRLNTPVEIEINSIERRINPETKRVKGFIIKEKRITPRKLSSVNRELATLRRMLNFAVTHGWVLTNPFDKTERMVTTGSEKSRERVLSFEEESRLLAVCIGERAHLRPILICALDTAMRPEEIFKLEWRDVDVINGAITLRSETTKTETARIIGLTPRLATELSTIWNLSAKKINQSVFGVKSIKNAFKTACRLADVAGFTFRDSRHTATTRMVNSGLPHAEIMKVTGHTQLKTFLRYVNLSETGASESAKKFGDYLNDRFSRAIAVQNTPDFLN